MGTFQLFVLLWQVSAALSLLTFIAGVFFRSWKWMAASFVTALPIAYYFLGAGNAWKLVGCLPILLLIASGLLWKKHKRPGSHR